MTLYRAVLSGFLSLAIAVSWSGEARASDDLIVIDGDGVSYEEFEQFAYSESRQTFYHGSPPEGDALLKFRREAADKLIERKLKAREARRRGLQPVREEIEAQLSSYEQQYGDSERWQTEGPAMLARLRGHFEEESLLEQIDSELRSAPGPDGGQVEAYYRANIDKFTEPAKVRLSVILLSVPAWADESEWEAAREEARDIARQIDEGLPFAEAAVLHSADATSAPNGGDMGFLHAGTLNYSVQEVLKDLAKGERYADPVTVLEGVVLVRLEDRQPATVRDFKDVQERAAGLWQREANENAYAAQIAELRGSSKILIDEDYLNTLPK